MKQIAFSAILALCSLSTSEAIQLKNMDSQMNEVHSLATAQVGDLLFDPTSQLMCMSAGKSSKPGTLNLKCEL